MIKINSDDSVEKYVVCLLNFSVIISNPFNAVAKMKNATTIYEIINDFVLNF